jgi:hypothetical protein
MGDAMARPFSVLAVVAVTSRNVDPAGAAPMVAPRDVVVAAPPLGVSAAIDAAIRPSPPPVIALDEYTIPLRDVVEEKNGIVGNTKGILTTPLAAMIG